MISELEGVTIITEHFMLHAQYLTIESDAVIKIGNGEYQVVQMMNLHKWLLIWSCHSGFGMMRPILFPVESMRFLSSFLGFALAIIISIFIFAPERLPVGYGFEPVPVDLAVENSLASQLVETVTGQNARNLVITNTSDRPINNLTITLRDENRTIKHQYIANRVPAAEQITLGWAQKWNFAAGDELEAAASTYTSVIWAL